QLLMSESADREKILETLFKTEIYKRIELVLKDAAREIKNRWSDATTRSQVLLQQADVATVNELQEEKEKYRTELAEAQARVAQARQKQDDARLKLNDGLQALDKLKELAESEAALASLEKDKERYRELNLRLKAAQEAA